MDCDSSSLTSSTGPMGKPAQTNTPVEKSGTHAMTPTPHLRGAATSTTPAVRSKTLGARTTSGGRSRGLEEEGRGTAHTGGRHADRPGSGSQDGGGGHGPHEGVLQRTAGGRRVPCRRRFRAPAVPTPSSGWTSAALPRRSCTSWPSELGLHELAVEDALGEHQRPKLDHYASHLFLSCHSVRVTADDGNARSDGDRRVHQQALADHRPQGRGVLDGPGARTLGCPRPGHPRCQLPALRAARRRRRRLLRDAPSLRRVLRRGQRGHLRRNAAPTVATATLVPDPPGARRFHRLVVPMREAVSGLMRRARGRR